MVVFLLNEMLCMMQGEMGFTDVTRVTKVLDETGGDVAAAVNILVRG